MKINKYADPTGQMRLEKKSVAVLTMNLILVLVAGLLSACSPGDEVITAAVLGHALLNAAAHAVESYE